MPVSRQDLEERASLSFFSADTAAPPGALLCAGTSCILASERAAAGKATAREVHCLGQCHRSPAWRDDDGKLHCGPAPDPEIRCLARRPIITERLALGDYSGIGRARSAGVWNTFESVLQGEPAAVLRAVEDSGERGRGGAGFPTGQKWRQCAEAPGDDRVVVANGDEGDPGSFVDRLLMERDPHALLEGLALCAFAVGAREGVVYVRFEYPEAVQRMRGAVEEARASGLLGPDIRGSEFGFEVHVVEGRGSYVCGEETALLEALEGRRGEVRLRPPYPAEHGLYGRPTVVNNVETLVNVPWIVREGPEAHRALGQPDAPGTKALCLNAGFAYPGVVEVEFGTSLRAVIEGDGGGGAEGRLAAVALGGPMGRVLLPDEWDVPIDPDAMRRQGVELGHGGLVALPEGTDWRALLVHWLRFMADESCGRCVPCRLGSRRAQQLAEELAVPGDAPALRSLLHLMRETSLCAFGQELPLPAERLLDLALARSEA